MEPNRQSGAYKKMVTGQLVMQSTSFIHSFRYEVTMWNEIRIRIWKKTVNSSQNKAV